MLSTIFGQSPASTPARANGNRGIQTDYNEAPSRPALEISRPASPIANPSPRLRAGHRCRFVELIPGGRLVYRHLFRLDIPINCRDDYNILNDAADQLHYLTRQDADEEGLRLIYGRRFCVDIAIEMESDRRQQAAVTSESRLRAMQQMAIDGLGWFPGLPWVHPRFEVQCRRVDE
ncbi:hypothetical protein N7462_006139 [Penicillium macrosclerotiorum]|uniref:uncharacterized protein n=1 Tax=Penicillium macrosclerotiorum TaxID=303699 RepID=UPI002547D1FC|nr:uncharacterized protein N7462_006139 [Penicillium macrosclerotiorum]KAJ5682974.1 hypothetical protein N7462_006139 [Penicillium macrosclerotiorum]